MTYPSKYYVLRREDTWEVWRANVGGDLFFIEEWNTEAEAKYMANVYNRMEENDDRNTTREEDTG